MQVIGIEISESGFRCGRIQNTEKPEFIKLKQFSADKKGLKALESWLDECCSKDHRSVVLSIVVEDENGVALAWRFHELGYEIAPQTYGFLRTALARNRERRTVAELLAQKGVTTTMRWHPLTKAQLDLRNALIEHENARIGCLQNQAKNENFQKNAIDFLSQLTRNASEIHANRMIEQETKIRELMKNSEFKKTNELLMTIPGMNELAAATLTYVLSSYPSETPDKFARLLHLHDGSKISHENYRMPELRLARNELFNLAMSTALDLPGISDMLDRMSDSGKSEKTIYMALAHKYARMVHAIATKNQSYRG